MSTPVATQSKSNSAQNQANPSADKNFSFSDLGIDLGAPEDADTTPPAGNPPAKAKVKPEPKEPEYKEPDPESEGEEPTDQTPPQDQDEPDSNVDDEGEGDDAPAKAEADADPFTEEDQPFLKKMHQSASQHFRKRLSVLQNQLSEKEAAAAALQSQLDQAGGKKLPDSWYEHEAAYTLSPQYQEVTQKFQQEQDITHFWSEQLQRCKANAHAREGDGFVEYQVPGRDGKPVTITEENYNPSHEDTIDDMRQQHYRNQEKLSSQAEKIGEEFSQKHKAANDDVRSESVKKLPWIKDKKHPYHKPYTEAMEKINPVHKNNPWAQTAVALAIFAIDMMAQGKNAKVKQQKAKESEDDQREAGPIPGRRGKSSNTTDDIVYAPEDMVGM